MNPSVHLSSRIQEVYIDGTWIANTNYKAEIENTRFEEMQRHFESLNSVTLLTQHIHYYLKGILQVIRGGTLNIRDAYSFDFSPITNQQEWEEIIATFQQDAEALVEEIQKLSSDQLDAPFADPKYGSVQKNIEGMIEHSYYHLGQIVLIKKMLDKR